MSVKLLTEHHLEILSLRRLHLSECHIVENHMSWLNYMSVHETLAHNTYVQMLPLNTMLSLNTYTDISRWARGLVSCVV